MEIQLRFEFFPSGPTIYLIFQSARDFLIDCFQERTQIKRRNFLERLTLQSLLNLSLVLLQCVYYPRRFVGGPQGLEKSFLRPFAFSEGITCVAQFMSMSSIFFMEPL